MWPIEWHQCQCPWMTWKVTFADWNLYDCHSSWNMTWTYYTAIAEFLVCESEPRSLRYWHLYGNLHGSHYAHEDASTEIAKFSIVDKRMIALLLREWLPSVCPSVCNILELWSRSAINNYYIINYILWLTTKFVKEAFCLSQLCLSILASLTFSIPVFWCHDFHSRVFNRPAITD